MVSHALTAHIDVSAEVLKTVLHEHTACSRRSKDPVEREEVPMFQESATAEPIHGATKDYRTDLGGRFLKKYC